MNIASELTFLQVVISLTVYPVKPPYKAACGSSETLRCKFTNRFSCWIPAKPFRKSS